MAMKKLTMNEEEPSLIYTNQKINPTQRIEDIATPPYYPTYSGLTPEQKWVYLNLLANPYNPAIDIGFVFILYYGLERHLLLGNFEKAIDVLLKLRDVHTNKSFQSYSANAIILSCMTGQKNCILLFDGVGHAGPEVLRLLYLLSDPASAITMAGRWNADTASNLAEGFPNTVSGALGTRATP